MQENGFLRCKRMGSVVLVEMLPPLLFYLITSALGADKTVGSCEGACYSFFKLGFNF